MLIGFGIWELLLCCDLWFDRVAVFGFVWLVPVGLGSVDFPC